MPGTFKIACGLWANCGRTINDTSMCGQGFLRMITKSDPGARGETGIQGYQLFLNGVADSKQTL
jgi:hypothetical protein